MNINELPPPPKKMTYVSVVVLFFLGTMAVWCVTEENWIGAITDFFLFAAVLFVAIARYLSLSKIYNNLKILYVVERIKNTPVMREEGCSIILTYLMPSPKIMEEIRKLSDEAK